MCTLHLIKPAIHVDANSAGSQHGEADIRVVLQDYNIATNVDLHITMHNDTANSLNLLPIHVHSLILQINRLGGCWPE